MRRTCVFFHAHPGDEAVLTSGTMASLAAEGHRVVLVVATPGGCGAGGGNGAGNGSGGGRSAELHASAAVLGAARVVVLGRAGHGRKGAVDGGFARAGDAAGELAELLRQEAADMLTVCDPVGGHGHPDHVRVHRVGVAAARSAGTPVVLEATVDRDALARGVRWLERVGLSPRGAGVRALAEVSTPSNVITHRVPVGDRIRAKRASMRVYPVRCGGEGMVRCGGEGMVRCGGEGTVRCGGGDGARCGGAAGTLATLLRLPLPLARRVLGTEFYVRRDLRTSRTLRHPLEAWPIRESAFGR